MFLCGDYNIDFLKVGTNDNFNWFYDRPEQNGPTKFIEVEVCNWNFNITQSSNKFVKEIGDANIFNKLQKNLNTNPNHNYEILSKHLLSAKLKHIPKKVKNLINADI